jgi:aminoglycoside 3-N-acetyltransferase I
MFGEAVGEIATYTGNRPSPTYLERLLSSDYFMALAALKGDKIVGGMPPTSWTSSSRNVARSASTIWLSQRRQGIATRLAMALTVRRKPLSGCE